MTSNAWPHVQLKDCVDLLAGFAFKSASFSEVASDIALVKGENVSQGKILWDISKRWPVADWQKLEKYQLAIGDVILAMDRPWIPAGLKWAFIRPEDPPALLVQRCSRLRSNSSTLFQGFLRYVIGSSEFEDYVRPITTGVNVPHISGSQILSFRLRLPPVSIQRRIAEILAAYDDLIENCERRIRILDEMARKLYREWFVHFRYPGHENVPLVDSALGKIPKGWTVAVLGELATFQSGYAFQSKAFAAGAQHRIVTIRNVQDGEFDPIVSNCIDDIPKAMPSHCHLRDRDILLSLTGNIGRVCLVYDAPFLLNQRVAKLLPRKGFDWAFTYCIFRDESVRGRLEKLANGVAQQNLSPIAAANLLIATAPDSIRECFALVAESYVSTIVDYLNLAKNLRRTRDLLLPRLLSGQLDVGAMA